jgi:hypothetical protein
LRRSRHPAMPRSTQCDLATIATTTHGFTCRLREICTTCTAPTRWNRPGETSALPSWTTPSQERPTLRTSRCSSGPGAEVLPLQALRRGEVGVLPGPGVAEARGSRPISGAGRVAASAVDAGMGRQGAGRVEAKEGSVRPAGLRHRPANAIRRDYSGVRSSPAGPPVPSLKTLPKGICGPNLPPS